MKFPTGSIVCEGRIFFVPDSVEFRDRRCIVRTRKEKRRICVAIQRCSCVLARLRTSMYAPSQVLATPCLARNSAVKRISNGHAKVEGSIPSRGYKGEEPLASMGRAHKCYSPTKSKTKFCVTYRQRRSTSLDKAITSSSNNYLKYFG